MQICQKSEKSKSWFIYLKNILQKYSLPDATELLDNPPEKASWKMKVKNVIFKYWDSTLKDKALLKSSLRHISWEDHSKPKAHHIWQSTSKNLHLSHKSLIKVKLMAHVYSLKKRITYKNESRCPLCNMDEEEDEAHFIASCTDDDAVKLRKHYICLIQNMNFLDNETKKALECKEFLTQFTLDFKKCSYTSGIKFEVDQCEKIEITSINFIHKLHLNRAEKLTKQSQC